MNKDQGREPRYYNEGSGFNNSFDEPDSRINRVSANANNNRSSHGGGRKTKSKRRTHIVAFIVVDVLIAALIMLVFYIFNYVVQPKLIGSNLPTPSGHTGAQMPAGKDGASNSTAQTAQDQMPNGKDDATGSTAQTAQGTPQPTDSVDAASWRVKFADKFTSGNVEKTETSYKDANINVSINKVQKDSVTYYLADIYVADIQYFKTAFAKQPDVMGAREFTNVVAKENNAILAINGDHCADNDGPVVRNGQLYRDQIYADALVMNYDGSMQTYSADQLDMDAIKANGAWQVWTFGPMLLKDGQPMTEFNSTLLKENPRTAVGYYEPGHYCFLVVDGRQPGYSDGMTFTEMSQLFYDLGCTAAFNLDGGQSSEMAFMGNVVNQPYNGGRSTTDILYIADK